MIKFACPTCGNSMVEFPETCDQSNTANCDGMAIATGDVRDVPAGLAPLALIPGAGLGMVLAHDLLPTSPARDAGNPAPWAGRSATP